MTEFLFMWLEKFGYTHPIHAPVTHVPMGMVMGACVFVALAVFLGKSGLLPTAKHCYVLALVAIPPTMFAGYMDWQHSYAGAFSPYILAKIIAGTALIALCAFNIQQLRKPDPNPRLLMTTATASLLTAIILGFCGGELQYGR